MKKLLNTLFVQSEDYYLSLENNNILAYKGKELVKRIPLINLENIVYFGYKGASPALLGACVKQKIGFTFLLPTGKFLARVNDLGEGNNVLLRKEQYRISDDEEKSLKIASAMIVGKILNARAVLMRGMRDHKLSLDTAMFKTHIDDLMDAAKSARKAETLNWLRGVEGNAAQSYFSLLDSLVLQDKKHFFFHSRNKRPSLDRVNALLSFGYTLLAHDCASALESVGLDSYVGFLHRDRPGRSSLALDLMEELRNPYVDRFVLMMINNRIITAKQFKTAENGAVFLNDEGRLAFLSKWQEKKKDSITHPFLKEKISWGLIPYVQAMLLARYIRGDLDAYPPFFWR